MKRCHKCNIIYYTEFKYGKVCDNCKNPHYRVRKIEIETIKKS